MTQPKVSLLDQLQALTLRQLEVLSRLFPDQSPNPDTPIHRVWFQAGQASVVRTLIQHAQKRNPIKSETNPSVFQQPQAPEDRPSGGTGLS